MKINTKFFDEIEIEEDKVVKFKNGIPGFENYKSYVVLDVEDKKFKCLQSIEDKDVCLILATPWDYFKDYEIKLSDDEIKELQIESEEKVLVFNVVNVKEKKITMNLLAPIVINIENNYGKQIILVDNKYNLREELQCLY